jgi:hypothetical protein
LRLHFHLPQITLDFAVRGPDFSVLGMGASYACPGCDSTDLALENDLAGIAVIWLLALQRRFSGMWVNANGQIDSAAAWKGWPRSNSGPESLRSEIADCHAALCYCSFD